MRSADTEPFMQAAAVLGTEAQRLLGSVGEQEMALACEIRLRVGARAALSFPDGIRYIGTARISRSQMEEMVLCLCGHSIYTHQHEMVSGYVSLPGGHRAGVCGTAVLKDGTITAIRDITTICVRIAREHRDCAAGLVTELFKDGLCSAIVAGAPGSGKTTLLRDTACILAERGLRVAVVDERGELARTDTGRTNKLCDVLRGYPKALGIMTALRSLSPDVLICDELGSKSDIEAVRAGVNAGVHMLCSLHAGSAAELAQRPQTVDLLATGAFSRFAVLDGRTNPGVAVQILRTEDIYALVGRNSDNMLCVAHRSDCQESSKQKEICAHRYAGVCPSCNWKDSTQPDPT